MCATQFFQYGVDLPRVSTIAYLAYIVRLPIVSLFVEWSTIYSFGSICDLNI